MVDGSTILHFGCWGTLIHPQMNESPEELSSDAVRLDWFLNKALLSVELVFIVDSAMFSRCLLLN